MTQAMFREQLRAADGAPLNIEFNSPGGIVTEGVAMFNALRAYKGRKVGIVTGICASIASVVLMACDEIRVAKGAYVMIHNPSGGATGGASDLRAQAELLESMRSELLDIYEARTGCERKRLEKMIDAETYMTAEEALEFGFADKVETFEARIALQAVARLDPAKIPAELRAAAKGKEKNMKPKMKAALEAAKANLAALEAQAAADPEAEPTGAEEEEPTDEDGDEETDEDDDDDDEKKESEKALLSTVYALTKTTSPATALGKLAGLVSKGTQAAVASRTTLVKAAVKAGVLAPALAKAAEGWPEKAWNSFLASAGGVKALKLGATHTPPKETPEGREEETRPTNRSGRSSRGGLSDKEEIARQMKVPVKDLDKPLPPSAGVREGGAV